MGSSNVANEKAKMLLDAQAHIWNHILNFLNSMALKCAIELDISGTIQKHGKPITLLELANALAIHPTKAQSLNRLMRILCHSNFFSKNNLPNGDAEFGLTISSQLLLKDHPFTLAPVALALLDPSATEQAHHLGSWFKNEHDQSPFYTAHGKTIWEHAALAPEFNEHFNKAMASDTRFVANLLLEDNEFRGLLEGSDSLVDVAGGDGTMAKAIANAFPKLKCTVLDLPHVIKGLQGNGLNLVYFGGNMFEAIPPADIVLLKWIMHDWDDNHCVRILKQCKAAIPKKNKGGKVIVIDMVVRSQNDNHITQLLSDMECMNLYGGGKERTEEEWKNLFLLAGFDDYKIFPLLGSRSVIVAYPS